MPFEDLGYSQFSECGCGPGCRRTFEQLQSPIGIEISLELKKRRNIEDKLLAQATHVAASIASVLLMHARPLPQLDKRRIACGQPRRKQCLSVRNAEAITSQSRLSSLAPATVNRLRNRSTCLGLIECTLNPRSISVSTTGPCGTSIAIRIASGVPLVVATSQSAMRASPSPLCSTWSRPSRLPS